jgi:hypothetical protein
MQKWEYCVFTAFRVGERTRFIISRHNKPPQDFQDKDRMEALAELGQQGWELVAVHPLDDSWEEFYFKRPLR